MWGEFLSPAITSLSVCGYGQPVGASLQPPHLGKGHPELLGCEAMGEAQGRLSPPSLPFWARWGLATTGADTEATMSLTGGSGDNWGGEVAAL